MGISIILVVSIMFAIFIILNKDRAIKYKVKNSKNLRDYTSEELLNFLENNEKTDAKVLACICSEVLRRKLADDKE